MKIYSSRLTYSTNILDELVGKDQWVLIRYDFGPYMSAYWIRIKEKSLIDKCVCDRIEVAGLRIAGRYLSVNYSMDASMDVNKIIMIKPIEMYTTEELYDTLEGGGISGYRARKQRLDSSGLGW